MKLEMHFQNFEIHIPEAEIRKDSEENASEFNFLGWIKVIQFAISLSDARVS